MATTKTTGQKHAELKRLAQAARDAVYDMLRLVDEILQDKDYVDKFGGEAQLLEHIEANEFAHFGGTPSLSSMLAAYRKNSRKATWQEYQFNIWAMIELARPAKDAAGTDRINWRALAKELEIRVKQLETSLEESKQLNATLRAKCEELMVANGELRGRCAVLEEYANAACTTEQYP